MFDIDHTHVKYDVVLRENERYGILMDTGEGKILCLPFSICDLDL